MQHDGFVWLDAPAQRPHRRARRSFAKVKRRAPDGPSPAVPIAPAKVATPVAEAMGVIAPRSPSQHSPSPRPAGFAWSLLQAAARRFVTSSLVQRAAPLGSVAKVVGRHLAGALRERLAVAPFVSIR